MRTKFYFVAALAATMLASCADEQFVGDNSPNVTGQEASSTEGLIKFSSGTTALTRADLYGSAAAAKLNNMFVVYGTKHASAEDKTALNDAIVFNNFQVGWTTKTAGTTASNSSDWEYVGLQAYDATPTSQAIKYWDYSANNGYTFYAFSSSDITCPKNTASDLVQVTKTTADDNKLYNKGYEVTVKVGATLNNLYFSDRLEVPETNYGKTVVSLTFRNIGAKVRFGFYETIPGYKVKIDKFYIDADAEAPSTAPVVNFANMEDGKVDGFYASLQNVKTSVDQTINVTYYDAGTVINRPKVSNPTGGYDYHIKLGDGTGLINTDLATSSASPTWTDGATGAYTPVFPLEENANPLLLKLDFTMTSEDNGEVIHVRGARAIVPTEYVKWKSNFAYTYIFKISDKSNGTTGDVDDKDEPTNPEGLKPITFDAIVVNIDDEKQETITSVSTNSITTYQEGAIVNEYTSGKPIYVAITNNSTHEVITPDAIGTAANNAKVYKLNDATTEAAMLAHLNGLGMGITKTDETAEIETTIPLVDGTTPNISNVKFTPAATGYYAYVYTTTAYVKPTYTPQGSGTYYSGNTYYMKNANDVYYVVSVPNADAFNDNKDNLYLASGGTTGVYDVKIIHVQ